MDGLWESDCAASCPVIVGSGNLSSIVLVDVWYEREFDGEDTHVWCVVPCTSCMAWKVNNIVGPLRI